MVGSTMAARTWPAAGWSLPGLWQVARAVARSAIAWPRCETRRRRGTGELAALDNRMLADLGVTRAYVQWLTFGPRD
jgi:uncharacterized protein YjiS (DUF1127 family)